MRLPLCYCLKEKTLVDLEPWALVFYAWGSNLAHLLCTGLQFYEFLDYVEMFYARFSVVGAVSFLFSSNHIHIV